MTISQRHRLATASAALLAGALFFHCAVFPAARSADYAGAAAILRDLERLRGEPAPTATPAADAKLTEADLAAHVRETHAVLVALAGSPASAAESAAMLWLHAAERWNQVRNELLASPAGPARRDFPPFAELLAGLPPPASWPKLGQLIDALPTTPAAGADLAFQGALQFLGGLLRQDPARAAEALRRLGAEPAEKGARATTDSYSFRRLVNAFLESADDPAAVEALFRQRVAAVQSSGSNGSSGRFALPNLVAVLGPEKARELLREAVVLPVALEVRAGERTRALARTIALERVSNLQSPQWELTKSLDGVELFEALTKRFPPGGSERRRDGNSYAFRQANAFYLLGLIARGRTDDALAQARVILESGDASSASNFPWYDGMRALRRAGKTRVVFRFLGPLLTEAPQLPLWETFYQLAAELGEAQAAIELTEGAAARADLAPALRAALTGHLADAYFAADRVDDGIKALGAAMAAVTTAAAASGDAPTPGATTTTTTTATGFTTTTTTQRDDLGERAVRLALQLARIGRQLGRLEWLDEGLATAQKA